ncbi:hypothetical protein [Frankia nepalensis]|uniref:hypothetical protein n=1 Tax=Frankia nepalensis TaxID=1836974 RepID=UPI001EE41D1B|nr:hypothetical protein [Frankia nepalensis]
MTDTHEPTWPSMRATAADDDPPRPRSSATAPGHPVADPSKELIKCRPVHGDLINELERAV